MNSEPNYIEKTMAGWYVIIHTSMDDIKLFGPFSSYQIANEELMEYLLCLLTPRISSAGLSSRS